MSLKRIAHRGYGAHYPENTLAAFLGASRSGADMIELDVTLTKDRRVVVIHDDTLERTTNGHGRVADHTLAELRGLDAGAWFSADYTGQRVPTLAEVLDALDETTWINIEIKTSAFEPDPAPDAIENQVVDLVRSRRAESRIIVSSFQWRFLERIADQPGRNILLGFLSEAPLTPGAARRMARLGAFSWHPDWTILTPQQVALARTACVLIYPYTVNALDAADRMMALGVDGFFTDLMTPV